MFDFRCVLRVGLDFRLTLKVLTGWVISRFHALSVIRSAAGLSEMLSFLLPGFTRVWIGVKQDLGVWGFVVYCCRIGGVSGGPGGTCCPSWELAFIGWSDFRSFGGRPRTDVDAEVLLRCFECYAKYLVFGVSLNSQALHKAYRCGLSALVGDGCLSGVV